MDHSAAPWAVQNYGEDQMEVDKPRPDNEEGEGSGEEGEGMSTDSSEEEDDDPEEARKIREGFIVDEDEEDEEEEEEDSDHDEGRHKKRHKKRRHRKERVEEDEDEDGMGELDEDDLDLVEEYTGQRIERPSKSRLKRLRRAGDSGDSARRVRELDEDNLDAELEDLGPVSRATARGDDLTDLWNDDGTLRVQRRDDDYDMGEGDDDDMRNFIEADEDDEENGMGEAERQERLERRRAEKERRRNAGAFTRMAGLDQNALAILYEVFGDGTDYDWALGDEDEEVEMAKETKYTDVFEPSEIRSRMLTEDDELIRVQDIPERMQLVTSSLSTDVTLSLDPPLSAHDLDAAAYWVTLRLGQRIEREFFREGGTLRNYLEALIAAVRTTLDFLFIQNLEVPFIAIHKKDFIWHIDGPKRIELLSIAELWRVYSLGIKFRAFQERKRNLEGMVAKLGVQDEYFVSDIQPKLDSMEAITDATEWFSAVHRKEFEDIQAIEGEGKKRPTRVSTLEMLKGTMIDQLVKDFCPPAQEISRKVREVMASRDTAVHSFLDDPDLPPLQHVMPYVDAERSRLMEIERKRWASNPNSQNEVSASQEVSAESLLERARLLIAMELGKDPLLKSVIRDLYKKHAVISCLPTEKGLVTIDDYHPFFNFKYLYHKPVTSMLRSPQFLHILSAETDHLVTVSLEIPEDVRSQFLNDLIQAVSSDGYSETSKLWNEVRSQAVTEAVHKYFLPFGARWTREWLREEVEDSLARHCGDLLEKRVDVKPFFTSLSEENLGAPNVMAVSWGDGDPKKDAIAVVCLDETGRLREHRQFDNLKDHDNVNEFLGMIKRRLPEVIIMGGFSPSTHKLDEEVRRLVFDPVWVKNMQEAGKSIYEEGSFDPRDRDRPIEVHYVQDAVARIFQHSKRAADEFGTLSVTTRYCIGLARYAQSPLNEYAALGQDITAITFDQEAQHLIPKGKLLMALERSLVNVVNRVGVDINRAVHDTYYQSLLPFVCGLGPRKAQHIVRKVVGLGSLVNREQFVRDGIMTTIVWLNAAAFLRIPQDSESKLSKSSKHNSDEADFSGMPDPLDATRLHPQDYELARKMAVDAMGVDEEDYSDEHPSTVVSMFMKNEEKDRRAQLEVLSLDDFAQTLLESTKEQKRMTLDLISSELLHPFQENRRKFVTPDSYEVLTMLTGETERTLRIGLILSVQVLRIKSNFIIVKLASSLEGVINATYLGEDGENLNPDRVVKPGQALRARVIAMDPAKFYIELSSRPSDLVLGDESYQQVDPDEYFNADRAARDKEILQRKKNSQQNKTRRMVKHPNFFNMNSKQAEEYLSKQHRGDVVIRPSSKGADHLAVTWKVDRGIYQHIDVLEVPIDVNDPMAGYKYIVEHNRDSQREFSDLDELIVNYVKAMARKVEELMNHDKYKAQTPEQLAETLTMMMKATPDKSFYAFCLNPDRAGYFNLMFKSNTHAPVTTWPVKVTPEAYVFFGEKLPSVPQLCDAFKMRHITPLAGGVRPMPSGMTPYGARTPGGRTPGFNRIPGQTPNPYASTPAQPPSMTTPVYGQPVTTGPQLTGYSMPPPQTPLWGQTPQQAPLGGMTHMNPARAAMIQQGSGWSGQQNGGSGQWTRR